MKLTTSEKKWVLETIKFDTYKGSYAVLKENGFPIMNVDLKINTTNLLENYFSASIIKEGAGSAVVGLVKGFFGLLKSALALVGLVAVGGVAVDMAKQYYYKLHPEALVKKVNDTFKDILQGGKVDNSAISSQATTPQETLWGKFSGKITSTVSHINDLIVAGLQKIGINYNLATSMAPVAMIVGSLAGAYIIFKLLKLLIAGVKKLISMVKGGKKEAALAEAGKMAGLSIKMQKSAISKIKDKKRKAAAQRSVAKKEARLKRRAA